MVSWQERLVHARELFPRCERVVNVGQDDLDVGIRDYGTFIGRAGKETGGTTLVVFDAFCATAIPCEVKLGDVVMIPRANGFGVVSVEYKYVDFAVESSEAWTKSALYSVISTRVHTV